MSKISNKRRVYYINLEAKGNVVFESVKGFSAMKLAELFKCEETHIDNSNKKRYNFIIVLTQYELGLSLIHISFVQPITSDFQMDPLVYTTSRPPPNTHLKPVS